MPQFIAVSAFTSLRTIISANLPNVRLSHGSV